MSLILPLIITLFQGIAAAAGQQNLAELAQWAQDVIAKIREVHTTPVTKAQLESLRG